MRFPLVTMALVALAVTSATADERHKLTAEPNRSEILRIMPSVGAFRGGEAVIRDRSGRTVGRIVREVGEGTAVRNRQGRTILRIR
jgi:hypothetical protein